MYKTSAWAGVLSTTGHSTNYVMSINIPMKKNHNQSVWVKRGAAMLCDLDY